MNRGFFLLSESVYTFLGGFMNIAASSSTTTANAAVG